MANDLQVNSCCFTRIYKGKRSITNRALTPVSNDRIFYDYHISWGTHEVFVLDTRTQRAYPGGDSNFPALISRPALESQLRDFSPTAEVIFLVIATPISGVPHIEEKLQNIARVGAGVAIIRDNGIIPTSNRINYYTDSEAYSYQEEGLQNLYAVIANRVYKRRQAGAPSGPARIVVLSGDVHYGFTNRVEFWGTRFYGMDDSNTSLVNPVHFVLAQLCASALKNEKDGYVAPPVYAPDNSGNVGSLSLHQLGYTASELQNPAEFMGWVPRPLNVPKFVGIWKHENSLSQASPPTTYWIVDESEQVFDIRKKRIRNDKEPESLTVEPDWVYRINYIPTISGIVRPGTLAPQVVTSPIGQSPTDALKSYLTALENYNTYFRSDGPGRELVGKNNIGEVFFEWGSSETTKMLRHTLWWSETSPSTGLDYPEKSPLSQFRLLLGEDATNYPKPTA